MFKRARRSDVHVAIDAQRQAAQPAGGRSDVDRAIGRLAGAQGGVVGRAQLRELGVPHGAIDHRVRNGRLIVVHRGVYAVGHDAIGDLGRAHAALIAAGPTAALSHGTAAALWRLTPSMPPFVDVTVLGSARRSRPGLRIHETVSPPEVGMIGELRVTVPLRTLADLKRSSSDFERLCAEALFLHLVTERELEDAGLIESARAAPTRSELERRFLRAVQSSGLPRPRVQHAIAPYVCDFVWPEERVVVETDGWEGHGNRFAFERDKARDSDLAARGWIVVRFTWRQIVARPMLVIARLAQVLARVNVGTARREADVRR